MIHTTNFPQIESVESLDNKEKTIVENDKKYNSAGVLIFSEILDGLNVYLFQSTNRVPKGKNVGEYYYGVAAGGICEKDTSVSDAARRELFEESCKTFMISQETLNMNYDNGSYVEIPAKSFTGTREHGNFRCYICNLTGQSNSIKNFYENNLSIVSNLNTDRVYKETKNIGVFNIKAFNMLDSMSFKEIKPMQVYDNQNNACFVDERTEEVVIPLVPDLYQSEPVIQLNQRIQNRLFTVGVNSEQRHFNRLSLEVCNGEKLSEDDGLEFLVERLE